MKAFSLKLVNKNGIKTDAAEIIVNSAKRFMCDIKINKNGRKVNAKRLFSVIALCFANGDELCFEIDGIDEDEALVKMRNVCRMLNEEN